MRRIATVLGALAAAACLPATASAQQAYDSCSQRPASERPQCRSAEKAGGVAGVYCRAITARDEDCAQIPFSKRIVRAEIDAHADSWLHRALDDQFHRGDDVPFANAVWPGTHNSYNSVKAIPALSQTDSNQQLSMTDQLRLDMRGLEIDIHTHRNNVIVCHAQEQRGVSGIGCTTERSLRRVLKQEIRPWLDSHPGEVLLVYLENHIDEAGETRAATMIDKALGQRVVADTGDFFALTRSAVADSRFGRVVFVGEESPNPANPYNAKVFNWRPAGHPTEVEDRPTGFDPATCANGGRTFDYAADFVRFYEDSTWLSASASRFGQAKVDDGLSPETTAAMVRCGVDLFGFDQLVPGDPRLPALVWSWAQGEEPGNGACTFQGEGARWFNATDCSTPRPAACRSGDGWLTTLPVAATDAAAACSALGATAAAPRTGAENADLAAAAADGEAWLTV